MNQLPMLILILLLLVPTTSHGSPHGLPKTHTVIDYTPIVRKAAPAVVEVSVLSKISPLESVPAHPESKHLPKILGSGVIMEPHGIVITCKYLIKDADKILIRLIDNREFEGKLIKEDISSDLTAIQLLNIPDNTFLPILDLETKNIEVGDPVLTLGNAFGMKGIVNSSIISTISRKLEGQMYIQTDAPINPGETLEGL